MKKFIAPGLPQLIYFLLLLSSVAGNAQPPTYRQYYDAIDTYVSKIISTKNGEIITVFVQPDAGNTRVPTYSSIVQRTTSTLQKIWSVRFPKLAIADVIEARNGDLLFSGTEWAGTPFSSAQNVSVIRTLNDGFLLWRRTVSIARATPPDTAFAKEHRLAEAAGGAIYFQCYIGSNSFNAFCLAPNGTLRWTKNIAYPSGFLFTDLTATFNDELLITGILPAGNTALMDIDATGKLRYIRTLSDNSPVHVTQILKDETKRQYYFCGEGGGDAQGTYAMVAKADADIESLSGVRAVAIKPDLFRCNYLPKSFGADAQGNVYCLYAGRPGSLTYRTLVDGDTAYTQIPACKFDASLNIAWRKRYVLPIEKSLPPFIAAAPQLALLNDQFFAALQTQNLLPGNAQPTFTSWITTTDTAGNNRSCVNTDEPFTVKNITLQIAGIRANLLSNGLNMTADPNLSAEDYSLQSRDTCISRKPPQSRFGVEPATASADTLCTGANLSFYDESYNEPQSWGWLFPAGADLSNADSSCFPNLYNVGFPQPGTYTIKLAVENGAGRDTMTKTITVIAPPKRPDLGPDLTFCPGDSLVVSYKDDAYSHHLFYSLTSSFSSTGDTVVIKQPGSYVCVVYSRCGTESDTITVQTARAPKADFITPVSCGNLSVSFVNASAANGNASLLYQWDFFTKNNSLLGSSAVANPSFTYPAYDTVKARLIVRSTLACTAPDTVTKVFVLLPKPVVSFSFTERCGDKDVSFNGNASIAVGAVNSYAWTFGDGTTDNTLNPTHAFPVAGTYAVQLTATSAAGCTSDAATRRVMLREKPVADFAYNNDACEGKAFTLQDRSTVSGSSISGYYWRIPSAGQTYTTASISPVITAAGPTTFYYTVTSAQGCTSDTFAKTILIESIPFASFTGGDGCAGDVLSFASTATTAVGNIQSYQWTVSNGLSSTQVSPQFSFPTSGSYSIKHKVVSGNGCVSNEAVKTIVIYSLPQPSFIYSVPCLNTLVAFTNTTPASANNSWQWLVNNNPFSASPAPSYTFTSPGAYAVAVQTTDSNGCTNSSEKTVVVEDFRLRLAAARNPVLPGEPVWLQTAAGVNYSVTAWTPASLFPLQSSKAQRVVTDLPLVVQVAAQSEQGCKDSASLLLDVHPLDDVYVPSAFTPNGDGKNDVLYVVGKGITDVDFKIYNRWGGLVFGSGNKTTGWDGTAGGKPLPSGTYVYLLKAKKADGQVVQKKGTVTVIR